MTNRSRSLDDLVINTYRNPHNRSLTRRETFVLGWFINNTKGRTYEDMAKDCKLSIEQCKNAVRDLMDIDLLRWG
ncbi:MAG: hypothetical protein F6J93_36670 [Oscillatoria sp. SIO1A7]|nr:hypothetical protein [Oscillatoria sp. SIO1A7]